MFNVSDWESIRSSIKGDKSMEQIVKIYTDGACSGNPGPGGWAYILKIFRSDRVGIFPTTATTTIKKSGSRQNTTNNQMEMLAVINSLKFLRKCNQNKCKIFTDSMYVINGCMLWAHKWKQNGWKTKAGKRVKNIELWKALLNFLSKIEVEFKYVKGHSGHVENERCDTMAKNAYQKYL